MSSQYFGYICIANKNQTEELTPIFFSFGILRISELSISLVDSLNFTLISISVKKWEYAKYEVYPCKKITPEMKSFFLT